MLLALITEKIKFKYLIFAAKRKKVILLTQVILMAQVDHTKVGFDDLSQKVFSVVFY